MLFRHHVKVRPLTTLVTLMSATLVLCSGCGGLDGGAEDVDSDSSAVGAIPLPDVEHDGWKFTNIKAIGSGCPKDGESYQVDISEDGQAFTITFSEYEVEIKPPEAKAVKNCMLKLTIQAPTGLTYAISHYTYSGYVFLEQPGMKAYQGAKYYYTGYAEKPARWAGTKWESEANKPIDNFYQITDEVRTIDYVWSPCGETRNLNIQTQIDLRNNKKKTGQGYISTMAVDGNANSVTYGFKMATSKTRCETDADAGPKPTPKP